MKVAVVGSYGAGLTMRVPRAPGPGETVSGGTFSDEHGGKGSNQAVAAARLGAEVSLLTAVGDDQYGRAAFELWRQEGVDARHIAVSDQPTMVGFITVEPSGENRICISSGALDFVTAELVDTFSDQISQARTVLISMEIPESGVLRALEIGRRAGIRTVLNPAPARPLPDRAWALIDVLTPNETEAPILLGLADGHGHSSAALATMLQAKTSGGSVVLTQGSAGALLVTGRGELQHIEAVRTMAVDTTGAGDAYSAALTVGLTQGLSLPAAARHAAIAGAYAVGRPGVIPSLPARDAVFGISTPRPPSGKTNA